MKLLIFSSIFLGFAFVFAEESLQLMKWIQTKVPDSAIKPPGKVNLEYRVSLVAIDPPEIKPGQEMVEIRFSFLEIMAWSDSRLVWNESDFDGQDMMHVPSDRLWKPDWIFLTNYKYDAKRADVNAIVYSNGQILVIPPLTLSHRCYLQNDGHYGCYFKVISWSYNGLSISPSLYMRDRTFVDLDDYEPIPGITVIGSNMGVFTEFYPCCEEPYPYIGFNITLKIDA